MISVKNLTFNYRETLPPALHDISFELKPGEVLGVVGSSAAGKTTLAYALAGLTKNHFPGNTQSGTIRFDNHEGFPLASRIGFVFQDVGIQLSGVTGTIEEEIAFSLEQFGMPTSTIENRIEEQLDLFQLQALKHRSPKTLSGGETQLLAIASETAKHPEILILDEPTQSLDVRNITRLASAIKKLKQTTAIVVTEECVNLTGAVADRILFLEDGNQRYCGPLPGLVNSGLDLSSLNLPEWMEAQKQLQRPLVNVSYRESVKWFRELRSSN